MEQVTSISWVRPTKQHLSTSNALAGAHDVRADSEPHRVEITSYEGFTHPDWDPNTLENDIALVRLPEKIEFNDYIRPACLPP